MNVVLIGLSGAGKSSVGRELAAHLGWEYLDTDDEIVRTAGKPIHRIFAEDGEPAFRELEERAVREALSGGARVVSLGGGAVTRGPNRAALDGCVVVLLEAEVETMARRLCAATTEPRPLLESGTGGDGEIEGPGDAEAERRIAGVAEKLTAQKAARELAYHELASVAVSTEGVSVAGAVRRVMEAIGPRLADDARLRSLPRQESLSIPVRASAGEYRVVLGPDLLNRLGRLLRDSGLGGRVRVISDETVYGLYGARVESALRSEGIEVESRAVRAGEASKTLETSSFLYDWLVEIGTERRDLIVALGGGVVGDLAGFVAATFLRGLKLVQVPTSLLAQVDSSVGGKVAVDHPKGKNLVGAFYPPRLVVADTSTLRTLPRREVSAALGEVAKHGMILDEPLFRTMEESAERLLDLAPGILEPTIARSIALKAQVVERDERESGLRAILNYGHTIGHAVEAVTGFEQYRHGEAVAIGMAGAARMAVRLGMLGEESAERQRRLLGRLGLPVAIPGLPVSALLSAMGHDKKSSEGHISWVLPEAIGRVAIRQDVPANVVTETLAELGAHL